MYFIFSPKTLMFSFFRFVILSGYMGYTKTGTMSHNEPKLGTMSHNEPKLGTLSHN